MSEMVIVDTDGPGDCVVCACAMSVHKSGRKKSCQTRRRFLGTGGGAMAAALLAPAAVRAGWAFRPEIGMRRLPETWIAHSSQEIRP